MKMTSYFHKVLKSRTMMVQFSTWQEQANTSWDSAMSDLTVALEGSFSCPRYFTQLSKQKAYWLIMGPVRQEENLFP